MEEGKISGYWCTIRDSWPELSSSVDKERVQSPDKLIG